MDLQGYEINSKIYEGQWMKIYRGKRLFDKVPVVFKTLSSQYPPMQHIARLKHEFEILCSLSLPQVIQAYTLKNTKQIPILVLEDTESESLDNYPKPMGLETFFKAALQVIDILGELHQKGVIHNDMTSGNLLWNSQSEKIQLIDFDFSTTLFRENRVFHLDSPALEGTVTHLSPEHTGRVNRSIDYRSDYYSLGVTFYEWLTGELPFISSDPIELIHSHIAKKPVSPDQINPSLPGGLSNIILKLLAKNPEDRYQSSYGLSKDLETCYQQYQQRRDMSQFQCGTKDIPSQFQISQKLYGREKEIESLQKGLEKVLEGGTEWALIGGPAGVGKSELVKIFFKGASQHGGFFCIGKFDPMHKNTPYFAIVQAFRELIFSLLTQSSEELETWKSKLLNALGANAQVIIDIIPEIVLIIGEQPSLPQVGPNETKNRFHLAFQNLLGVFAQKKHPLVLFLDDLQWSDPASLELIEHLITSPVLQCIYIIGSFRDNEIDSDHPVFSIYEKIEQTDKMEILSLQSLEFSQVNELLCDTLHCDSQKGMALAKLIYEKTRGNPFFVKEFLDTLQHNSYLWYQSNQGVWGWDLANIGALEITENVLDLILHKLKDCSEDCRHILSVASCLGNEFDQTTLSFITDQSPARLAEILWEAVVGGIIVLAENYTYWEDSPQKGNTRFRKGQRDNVYRFQHDRIQQALYSQIDEKEREMLHPNIGRSLLKHLGELEKKERIFDILGQFNPYLDANIELNRNAEERLALAKLNLEAAQKARNSVAYAQARDYIVCSLKLLEENIWESHYDLSFAIWCEAAKCDFLCGKFEEAEAKTAQLLDQARTTFEKADVQNLKVVCYTSHGNFNLAIQEGLQALHILGQPIPIKPNLFRLLAEMGIFKVKLGKRSIAALLESPTLEAPEPLIMSQCLKNLVVPAYTSGNSNLVGLATFKNCNLSLKHGNHPFSADAFVAYGLIQCSMGNYETGYQFGKLAVALAEHFQTPEVLCNVYFVFAVFISPWKKHRNHSVPLLRKAYQTGLQSGDLFFAGYSALHITNFQSELDLPTAYQEAQSFLPFIESTKDPILIQTAQALQQIRLSLLGSTPDPASWDSYRFEEDRFFSFLISKNYIPAITWFSAMKIEHLFLFEDYDKACELIEKTEDILRKTNMAFELAATSFFLYSFFTMAAFFPETVGIQRYHTKRKLRSFLRQIKKWSEHCPDNFNAVYWLAQAEWSSLKKNYSQAEKAYDRAIDLAEGQKYPQRLALAQELAAKHYWRRGQVRIARVYMKNAFYTYHRWGAKGKLKQLKATYPQLLRDQSLTKTEDIPVFPEEPDTPLDLASLIKMSQAISKETRKENISRKLIHILLENAGAQKAYFLLGEPENLTIQAWGEIAEKIQIHQETHALEGETLPLTLIQYVARTRKTVVLEDATQYQHFKNDPYILKSNAKSLLCTAISIQGRFLCVLYLENNLTTNVFSANRLEVLKVLSSQVAISLDNATLYDQLTNKTKELEATLSELREVYSRQNDIIEQERLRIAQDLHDEAQQIFGMVKRNYARYLPDSEKNTFNQEMESGQQSIDSVINDLYPPVLRTLGLVPAIEEYTMALNQKRGTRITFKSSERLNLPERTQLTLFRIIQEALSNVIKHSGTMEAEVLFSLFNPKLLWIQISDTGQGFDSEAPSSRYGLHFMRERAKEIDAQLSIQSSIGDGTTIICKLPL